MLTIENSSALVPGAKPQENDMAEPTLQKKRVRVLRDFHNIGGKVLTKDTVVDLPKIFAGEVVAANKAVIVDDDEKLVVGPSGEERHAIAKAAAEEAALDAEKKAAIAKDRREREIKDAVERDRKAAAAADAKAKKE